MEFRIADTFTDSLARLTGDEQKAVKTTAFDLQLNPSQPGLQLHKLDKPRDPNFWSVRVSKDVRLIVHKSHESLLLCYVGHHDKAYDWAERRKLETHPKTGAAQLVEVRETVQEIIVPVYVQAEVPLPPKPCLFAEKSDDQLLAYGVPPEWLSDVRQATEDTVLALADHLPSEAAEALLELATGGKPEVAKPAATGTDPFAHPDAQRRFRLMNNMEELERALDYPWEKWTVFLHPAQRQWVERDYSGPARVSGSAGTGKTIVALHRAVFLARAHPDARVLLTTFSDILANALRTQLRRLISNEPLEVHSIDAIGQRLFKSHDLERRALGDVFVPTGTVWHAEAPWRRAARMPSGWRPSSNSSAQRCGSGSPPVRTPLRRSCTSITASCCMCSSSGTKATGWHWSRRLNRMDPSGLAARSRFTTVLAWSFPRRGRGAPASTYRSGAVDIVSSTQVATS